MKRALFVVACLALTSSVAFAQVDPKAPADPAASREQLKIGFELKKQGDFAAAVGHLEESVRLDPKALKPLLNLADCEEHLNRLVAAQAHWVRVRDQAAADGSHDFEEEAKRRLADVEARMPRLTVTLAPEAPPNTEVVRDDVALGAVSLGAPLPTDPGKHLVIARAAGYAPRGFEITLAERETKSLTVTPGPRLPDPPSPVFVAPPRASSTAFVSPPPPLAPVDTTQRTFGVIASAAGGVCLGAGLVFGGLALSNKNASNAGGHCDATGCDAEGKDLRQDALRDATFATILVVGGGALLAGGLVVVATAPSNKRARAALTIAPGFTSVGGVF
jgi:hypothetical protein